MEKWGKHVFNTNHPAYTTKLWEDIIKYVKVIRTNFNGELSGFDKAVIKRQLWHMMFLEEDPSNHYDTIAYNDHEYLNEYDGIKAEFIRFQNSGLGKDGVMSFTEYLKHPAWFCDWVVEWSTKQNLRAANHQANDLEEIAKQAELEAKKKIPPKGFMNKSY